MRPPDSISVQRALISVHHAVADHQLGVVAGPQPPAILLELQAGDRLDHRRRESG